MRTAKGLVASRPSMPPFPIVLLRNVQKSYALGGRRVDALRGVDLCIDEPGFHAIMGRSGSGKSTMLHLLGGLDRPDAGEVHVGGERIDSIGEPALVRYRRRRVGIVFQQFNLLPTLSAIDNVMLPGVLDGAPRRELAARADGLLARLGLGDRRTHRPDALSGGEQQRVAIARALLFAPPVLLADEPTGNLDTASSDAVWSALDELAAIERFTMVMVTHEAAAAVRCRRVVVLRDGSVADSFEVNGIDAGDLAHRAERSLGSAR